MEKHRIYSVSVASVYPYYVAKAEKKGRTQKEVDQIMCWLTGYTENELDRHLHGKTNFETFFTKAKKMNPKRTLIRGVVCGVRVEEIKDPIMRELRYLDKLIDELAKGKSMESILRSDSGDVVGKYIAEFPKKVQERLQEMRTLIKSAAPDAQETIKYGIPTFVLQGNLVHFGGYKSHIGFYPAPSGIEKFKKELSKYKSAKGSVQFPLDEPLPLALITKIVKFRVKENLTSRAK